MSTRGAAIAGARRGWFVFPCRRDGGADREGRPAAKCPLVRRWEERASSDPGEVARSWPGRRFNVGIACGPSGLVVIDLDPPDGPGQLEWLRGGRDLPSTYTVVTPRAGRHLYYTAIPAREVRSSAGKVASDIDVRAVGGYIVGAGSIAGGRPYTVTDDRDPVPLPGWLAMLASPPPPATTTSRLVLPPAGSRYGAGALRRETGRIEAAPRGTRNAQLNASAWALFRLVADGLLDEEPVTSALRAAAGQCGLTADDGEASVQRTIASARRAGLAAPHYRRPA